MRQPLPIAFVLTTLATPALAQFPPPGVYACTNATGAAVGELNLFTAGDYTWVAPDGTSTRAQLASAGTSVTPLSGPLKDMGLTGAFATDDTGVTQFRFAGANGLVVSCK